MKNKTRFDSTLTTISNRLQDLIGEQGNNKARAIKVKVDTLRDAVRALENTRVNKSPTITDEKHFSDISMLSNQLGLKVKKLTNEVVELQKSSLTALNSEISERLGLTENKYASELRSALRQMNNKERAELTLSMIKEGRGEDLAAIINAPAELSGLTVDHISRLREQYESIHAPDLIKERDLLVETVASAHVALSTGEKAAIEYTDAGRLQDIENAEAAANDAKSAFKDSLLDNPNAA